MGEQILEQVSRETVSLGSNSENRQVERLFLWGANPVTVGEQILEHVSR
jgi:hypothetical protein